VYLTALLLQQIPMASKFGREMFQAIQTTYTDVIIYIYIYLNNRIVFIPFFIINSLDTLEIKLQT